MAGEIQLNSVSFATESSGSINLANTAVIQPKSSSTLILNDEGGTASITVATDGKVTLTEDLVISSTKGIDFGTSKLTDYEEGTWTPASASGSGINSTVSATYTKIGRTVNLHMSVTMTGGGGAAQTYSGLPFTPSTNHTSVGVLSLSSGSTNVTNNSCYAKVTGGSTTITMLRGGDTALTGDDVNPSGNNSVIFTITYQTG